MVYESTERSTNVVVVVVVVRSHDVLSRDQWSRIPGIRQMMLTGLTSTVVRGGVVDVDR